MPLGAHKVALFGVAGVSTGDVVLLSSQTASDSASLDFTSGIDSTYGEYIFRYYNCNPVTDRAVFQVGFNVTGESDYNEVITSVTFTAYNTEGGGSTGVNDGRDMAADLAQAAGPQVLTAAVGNGGDESCVGELHLFNPASTTYVKHFYFKGTHYQAAEHNQTVLGAGYINVTGAISQVQWKMSTGNFDGTVKLWGVKN
jgi:hypothetical protein